MQRDDFRSIHFREPAVCPAHFATDIRDPDHRVATKGETSGEYRAKFMARPSNGEDAGSSLTHPVLSHYLVKYLVNFCDVPSREFNDCRSPPTRGVWLNNNGDAQRRGFFE